MNALERFHASWPRGVAPSVVEHFGGAADHVAPAMTLWSGAERVGAMLASAGLEPGTQVGCALPPGIRWVQTFMGCLMRRVTFWPVAPGASPANLRAFIDGAGRLTTGESSRPLTAGEAVTDGTTSWNTDALDAVLSAFGSIPLPRSGARIVSEAPWWEPGGLASAVWLGLSVGAELHVGVTDEEVHRLGPDVVVARPGRLAGLLDWAPPSPRGLAVIAGDPHDDDRSLAGRRGWQLLGLPLKR